MSLTTFEIVQFSNSQSHHLSFAGLGQVVMYRRTLKKNLEGTGKSNKIVGEYLYCVSTLLLM